MWSSSRDGAESLGIGPEEIRQSHSRPYPSLEADEGLGEEGLVCYTEAAESHPECWELFVCLDLQIWSLEAVFYVSTLFCVAAKHGNGSPFSCLEFLNARDERGW